MRAANVKVRVRRLAPLLGVGVGVVPSVASCAAVHTVTKAELIVTAVASAFTMTSMYEFGADRDTAALVHDVSAKALPSHTEFVKNFALSAATSCENVG